MNILLVLLQLDSYMCKSNWDNCYYDFTLFSSVRSKVQSTPMSYFTTKTINNTRQYLFYNTTNNAGRNLIAWDEPLETTGAIGEILTLVILVLLSELTLIILNRISMLLVMGQYDFIFCNFLNITSSYDDSAIMKKREQYNYSTPIEIFFLPHSGYNINLHLNAWD